MEKREIVKSRAYRLVAPGKFEETVLQHELKEGKVVVKPSIASICHADLRYYTGQRRKEALAEKLPMALFHEGIGRVVKSMDESIAVGQRVVIVPTIPGRLLNDDDRKDSRFTSGRVVADNYSENSVFLGSGYDGIGQEHLVLPAENVIPIPDDIPDTIAVLAELNSVSLHALSHVTKFLRQGKVAVFGDGPVGYLTAAMLHHMYDVPKSQLLVFGAIPEKLAHFDFATTYLVHDFDFHSLKGIVTVIECTGGRFSESAINQAIDLIAAQGKIILMGVTEERVPINTRDVLEKGLTLYGSSRSTAEDFATLMNAFRDEGYQSTLKKLIPEQNDIIRNASDLQQVMNRTAEHKGWQKTIMVFEW